MTDAQSKLARHPAALLMQIRTLHTYVGMLIAPAVLFFACTGILQIYGLHEAHGGYTPPPLVEKLGRLHRDQVFALRHRSPASAAAPSHAAEPAMSPPGGDHAKLATTLLKAFFAAVAVGLIFSTSVGVWMALRQSPRRRSYLLLLLLGAGVPLVLATLSA